MLRETEAITAASLNLKLNRVKITVKNKKTLYFVVPALLVIWGIIFYKVFNALNPQDDLIVPVSQNLNTQTHIEKSDTFSIYTDYPDPFLSGSPKQRISEEESQEINVPKQSPIVPIKQVTPWPAISYSGMIKNQKSNKQLALIQINGKENIAASGTSLEGITIQRIFKDSVEVSFNKEKKFIKKGR